MDAELRQRKREREKQDDLAELYAILLTTQKLEKAFIGGIVSNSEYETECINLIAQFKTLHSTLLDSVPSPQSFAEAHKLDCSLALNRIHSGVPATIEHTLSTAPVCAVAASDVAECVQHFITAMDYLGLQMFAVDQVHPPLTDLIGSLTKLRVGLPPDFEGFVKVRTWIDTLSEMQAADELTEAQARQLYFDLDSSYSAFMTAMNGASCV